MKRILIYLKSGLSLEYEVDGPDKIYEENGFLQITGWKKVYTKMETDSGTLSTLVGETAVKSLIILENIEFYEITEI